MVEKNIWVARAALWMSASFGVFILYSYLGVTDFNGFAFFVKKTESKPAPLVIIENLPTEETRLRISAIGLDSPIVFPQTDDLKELRRALDEGVVHYRHSAFPEDSTGKVFLFGHSSSRAFEENPARNVFTGLNRLKPKDSVEIWRRGQVYAYRVKRVRILNSSQAEVYLASFDRELTLSTCWPVGDPANRFIVEAEFVRSYPQFQNKGTADTSS